MGVPAAFVGAALRIAVSAGRHMPAPTMHIDDLAVVREPDAGARHADPSVCGARTEAEVIEEIGGRNASAHDDGARVLLQTSPVEYRQIEILVAVAGRLHHRYALRGG